MISRIINNIKRNTAAASRIDVGGYSLNSLLLEAVGRKELKSVVFIHGASTSLSDPLLSFRAKFEGRAQILFVDRPGHGASDQGSATNVLPDGQADAVATLMEKRGMRRAIIVGHSFGGAVAAALALRHPEKVTGLVFLSPALYPWSGGVAWYYSAACVPVLGYAFSILIVPFLGLMAINRATKAVFAPQAPPRRYIWKTRALQAITPAKFRHNAKEIVALSSWAEAASTSYTRIHVPTVIITGDKDAIVSPEVHARQLSRDIAGSKLIVVPGIGHKSDFCAGDLVVAAIEDISAETGPDVCDRMA